MQPINIIDRSQKKFHERSIILLAEWTVVKERRGQATEWKSSLAGSFAGRELHRTQYCDFESKIFL